MGYRVGIEDIEPNHYVAWVFDNPSVFGSGKSREEALDQVKARLGYEVEVTEEFKSKPGDGGYIINALFEDDLRLVTAEEISKAGPILEETLSGIIHAFERHPDSQSVDTINHISQAEWWYFDRLNLSSPREELPEDPIKRLRVIHQRTVELLPRLVETTDVTEKSGESWSARKVLRRALWHRQDHLKQLEKT